MVDSPADLQAGEIGQPTAARAWRRWGGLLGATAASAALATAATAAPRPTPDRPNIILVLLDDAGYGDFASYGHPTLRTPNLDRMAREGVRFTQFYSASPACTASRYALLTGRLPARSGFRWVLGPDSERGLHPDERTLPEVLRERGYATACFGKWHLGQRPPWMPLQHGFDRFYGLPYSNDMLPPKHPDLPVYDGDRVAEVNPDQTRLTGELTRRAVAFIEEHREKPFFLYVPFTMPHVPLHAGPRFAGRSPRGAYGDVMEEVDAGVGAMLDELRRLDLAERTLVIVTSDNGPWIIKGEEGGSAGLLRDGKGSTWEGGVRVPCVAWWPGVVPSDAIQRHAASMMDLFPTIIGLAGGEAPTDRAIDGRDMLPLLLGEEPESERDPLFFYGYEGELYAVRSGPWKLHVRTYSQTGRDYFDGRLPLLFDVERDPSELFDVADAYPQVVAELQGEVDEHLAVMAGSRSFWDADGADAAASEPQAGTEAGDAAR